MSTRGAFPSSYSNSNSMVIALKLLGQPWESAKHVDEPGPTHSPVMEAIGVIVFASFKLMIRMRVALGHQQLSHA